jgi:hypothetical protein
VEDIVNHTTSHNRTLGPRPANSVKTPAVPRQLSREALAVMVAGFGLGCASMVVAARGGAASGSVAPFVITGSMPAVILATMAGASVGRSLADHGRRVGLAAWATLALFAVAFGWLAMSMAAQQLPSWPLVLLVAGVVALPGLVAATLIGRGDRA